MNFPSLLGVSAGGRPVFLGNTCTPFSCTCYSSRLASIPHTLTAGTDTNRGGMATTCLSRPIALNNVVARSTNKVHRQSQIPLPYCQYNGKAPTAQYTYKLASQPHFEHYTLFYYHRSSDSGVLEAACRRYTYTCRTVYT